MKIDYNESGDLSRLEWTLKDGATPLSRIYSTIRHLGSKMGIKDVELMINELVESGKLVKEAHPLRQNEYFFKLASK